MGYLNAQTVREKTEDIVELIVDLDIDLLFITETWLLPAGDESVVEHLAPPGYTAYSRPRETRLGGGIAIIYRNSVEKHISIDKSATNHQTTYESLHVSLDLNSKFYRFLCVYRPPYSTKNRMSVPVFIDQFQEHLSSESVKKGQLIVLGDINYHYEVSTNSVVKQMRDIIDQCNMKQIIQVPTHRAGHTLDWVIIPNSQPEAIVKHTVHDIPISDHRTIVMELNTTKCLNPMQSVTSRNIKKINLSTFRSDITTSLSNLSEVNINNYDLALKNVLDQHAPLATRSITQRPYSPWYTADVKEAKKEVRKAEKKFNKSGLTIDRDIYKTKRAKWKRTIRDAKRQFYLTTFEENRNSSKHIFGLCDKLLGKTKTLSLPKSVPINELPEMFANAFIDKTQKIRKDLSVCKIFDDFELFNGVNLDSFQLVCEKDVKTLILESPKKYCDLDPLPSPSLLSCIDVIVPVVTQILNQSLKDGIVPESFKNALVKPLLKKPTLDQESFKNYRPVSNLPFLSKILEKVVLRQLLAHLKSNNLVESFQSAYRANHSTETALLRVVNDILYEVDNRKIVMLNLLDLSAAFDTIDHDILLRRLELTFGITGSVLEWFKSYLTDRFQTVVVGDERSSKCPLKCGVPQGSVLGPVLFTIYTQPLANVIRKFNVSYHFYADDTQIYGSFLPQDSDQFFVNIVNCIQEVKVWMDVNRLKLNDDKTEIILFGSDKNLSNVNKSSISIGDTCISLSSCVKNLGIYLDSDLSMSKQVSHIMKCIYLDLRRISQIRHLISVDIAQMLATSLIMSKLDYCNSILSGVNNDLLRKLKVAQNNAARLVLKKKKRDHASPLLTKLHWLPIDKRISYKLATLCYRCLNDLAPAYLSELLIPYVPSRQLRSSSDTTRLTLPNATLKSFGERRFSYYAPKLWNSLPRSMREARSVESFKQALKTYLFQL